MKEPREREHYARLIREFFARFDAQDVAGLLELFCEDATMKMPLYATQVSGKGELRQFFQSHISNWKEHREWATSIIVEGQRAASELHFEGITLSGEEIVMDNVNIYEFARGKIKAIRVYADTWEFRQKLGI